MSDLPILNNPRVCGECSMCCKLLRIRELDKPPNQWCPNCSPGKGCNIYGSHPDSCKTFKCLWLGDKTLPDFMRPDRCKFVVWFPNPEEGQAQIHVDTSYPEVFNGPAVKAIVRSLIKLDFYVIVTMGDKRIIEGKPALLCERFPFLKGKIQDNAAVLTMEQIEEAK